MSMSLTINRVLKATPERLYEVWTDPTHLSNWFGVKVDAEPRVGSVIRFHFGEESGPVAGKFLALEPHHLVSFTWSGCDGAKEPKTTVRVTFTKEAQGTRLTLTHDGFLDPKSFDAHDEGWLQYLELWAVRLNAGPEGALRASISEVFDASVDAMQAVARWLGKPVTSLRVSEDSDGTRHVADSHVAVRLKPCRFGTSVALSEWGFDSETQRLAARQRWIGHFAALKGQG